MLIKTNKARLCPAAGTTSAEQCQCNASAKQSQCILAQLSTDTTGAALSEAPEEEG